MITGFGDRMPRGKIMLGGVAVYGLGVAAFAFSPWFQLSMFLMIIIGFANVCTHALVQTVIQTYSPPEFRGRTIALFHMSQVVMTVGSMIHRLAGRAFRHPVGGGADGQRGRVGDAGYSTPVAAGLAYSLIGKSRIEIWKIEDRTILIRSRRGSAIGARAADL